METNSTESRIIPKPYAFFAGRIDAKKNSYYRLAWIIALAMTACGIVGFVVTWTKGLGIWNIDPTVCWGWSIANFIFWIGLGHAGTLISAILLLFRARWRSALSRSAETMTIAAIIISAIFPLIHTGRPWFTAYWLLPYPSRMSLWINFTSPLVWDFFAIGSYFILSIIFWYQGMVPDFGAMRHHIKTTWIRKCYSGLSLGWTGTRGQWSAFSTSYKIMAGLAAALVISVHSIVSLDFAVTVVPGWHSTLFPPYFVAGAILSGCAMVVVLMAVSRKVLDLDEIINVNHFDNLNKISKAIDFPACFILLIASLPVGKYEQEIKKMRDIALSELERKAKVLG